MCAHSSPGIDARDQVEREDPLEPFLLAVDREADPLVEERGVDRAAPLLELLDAQRWRAARRARW